MYNLEEYVLIWKGFWTPQDCLNNPKYLFVFGDNLMRIGNGGQAIIRGLPNTIGIATKKAPGVKDEDYFNDSVISSNTEILKQEFRIIHSVFSYYYNKSDFTNIVLSENGYGHGLSQMDKRCPETYHIFNTLLDTYFKFDNLKAKELSYGTKNISNSSE